MAEKRKIDLKIGDPLPYELSIKGGAIKFPAGYKVTREILRMLEEGRITQIEIDWSVSKELEDLVLFEEKKPDSSIGIHLKNVYLHKRIRDILNSILGDFNDPLAVPQQLLRQLWIDPTEKVDLSKINDYIDEWIESSSSFSKILAGLGWNAHPDEFFHAHQIDTSRLVTWFGQQLKLSHEEIRNLAIAGILHDIGELFINPENLTKNGELSKSEMNRLREHPRKSIEWLKRAGFDDELLLRIVLRHHERFDGSGYPFNIRGKFIEPVDYLFALTDVYIALISTRPHRNAYLRRQALKIIIENKGTWFPDDVVENFVKALGLYPPGSIVELKSGAAAIILNPPEKKHWQALKINLQSPDDKPKEINLLSLKNDYITREISL